MKILVTGSNGFIGKNLVAQLKNIKYGFARNYSLSTDIDIYEFETGTDRVLLDSFCADCDFVFNLAGVNRPQNTDEFMEGNFGFACELLETLEKHNNRCPVMLASSIQAELNNPYGESKRAGENLFFDYSEKTGAKVLVYRFPNVFGKWCKPNYNSAVATFCNNIANDLPVQINDRSHKMTLVYIDDVVDELVNSLSGHENKTGEFCKVNTEYNTTLGEIVDLIYSFKQSRNDLIAPDMTNNSLSKVLYSTYLSYLPKDKFSYPLQVDVNESGAFTEVFRNAGNGKLSVYVFKPHALKGQHWHNSKNEKILVVSGKGAIRFRNFFSNEVIEYFVSGERPEVVDVPTGYVHNVENIGDSDMIAFMWYSESYNSEKPDTYFCKV